jgi:hypothetical protein
MNLLKKAGDVTPPDFDLPSGIHSASVRLRLPNGFPRLFSRESVQKMKLEDDKIDRAALALL